MKDSIVIGLLVTYILSILTDQGSALLQGEKGESGIFGTGGLGGPQCPADGCPVDCHCNDDPHMKTFDGSYYEMQQKGKFYLYKHSTQPIWVQGFFQSCGYNGAFCSCGAAVRYFGESFVVDKCERPGGARANVVAKLGTGTSLLVDAYFAGYKISVPGALRVFLGSHSRGIGTISVQTNPSDLNSINGLCGKYDGNRNNDFTWRSGELTDAGTTYPYDFADSWRVPLAEDLFSGYTLDNLAPCVEVANSTFVPQGVADACFLNITPSAMIGSGPVREGFSTNVEQRRRRQVVNNFPNGEWPNGWTYMSAFSFCHDYLFASQAVVACTSTVPVVINANPFIESCARDIQLTGGTSFASVASTALLTNCVSTLEAYNISSTVIGQDLCPFNCSSNGECLSGVCICNLGWSGLSCSQATNEVPSITNTSPSSSCPPSINGTKCYAAYLYGGPFVNSGTLSATGFVYQANNPLQTKRVQVDITYISSGVVIIRILVPKCSLPRPPFVLVVNVSNDGVNYSASVPIAFNL